MRWRKSATSNLIRKGDRLILHTDNGEDKLFVVQYGEIDCYKVDRGLSEFWRTFSDDQVFGIFPSLYSAPRNAIFTARSASIVYTINRELYTFLVRKQAAELATFKETMLRKIDFLTLLDDDEHSRLLDIITEDEFSDTNMIIQRGDPMNTLYIIASGSISVKKEEGGMIRRCRETSEDITDWQLDFGERAALSNRL